MYGAVSYPVTDILLLSMLYLPPAYILGIICAVIIIVLIYAPLPRYPTLSRPRREQRAVHVVFIYIFKVS